MSGSNPGATSNTPIGDDETAANAPGLASIIERLGGNAWRLYQVLTGTADDGPPSIGRNPQGLYGRDYSGPPFGPAHRHPIATFGGAYNPSNIEDPADNWQYLKVDSGQVLDLPIRLWVRAHHQHRSAPYSRGYWSMYARTASAGSPQLTMYQAAAVPGPFESCVMTVSGTSSSMYDWDADGNRANFYTPLVPGINNIHLLITSDSAIDVYIHSLTLNQVAKRSH